MNTTKFRKTAIAGAAAVAFVAAGALTTPTEAHAGGKVAAAIVGGAILGGLIASQTPVYGAPVYGGPVYGAPVVYAPSCYWTKQKTWNPYYGYYTYQKVKVCN